MIKPNKKISVLIPDGEKNGFAFRVIACLAKIPNIEIFIMANAPDVPVRFSRYIKHYSFYPPSPDPTLWIKNIIQEVAKYNIDVILPIETKGIHKIIQHKNDISPYCQIACLPSLEEFELSLDKRKLASHCESNVIDSPNYYFPEKTKNYEILGFPVLVKDTDEGVGSGTGVKAFQSLSKLKTHLNAIENLESVFVQEYINGFDIDCSVLCKNGRIKAYTIQKGLDYSNAPFSPPIAVEFVENSKLLRTVEKLMSTLNWSGIAHIDLRYDEKDHTYKVIEVNPRYWYSLDASMLAGINFPYLHILMSLDYEFKIPEYQKSKISTLKGILKVLKRNPLILLRPRQLWRKSSIRFILQDPLPVLVQIWLRISSPLKKFAN